MNPYLQLIRELDLIYKTPQYNIPKMDTSIPIAGEING